jgi:hypothetical protein
MVWMTISWTRVNQVYRAVVKLEEEGYKLIAEDFRDSTIHAVAARITG